MQMKKLRSILIGDRAFYREVLTLLVPIIIQNTISNVVSLLDNVMVGQVGTLPMSAVAIVNQLLFIFNLCIFGGLAGAGIFATQFAGAGDHEGMRSCFRVKMMIVMSMLVLALIVFVSLPEQMIGMFLAEGTSDADIAATMQYGMDYLRVMLWGLLPFGIAQMYAGTLRELGETRMPMIASVSSILVNLVFNYFLIFGKFGFPELGVTGAAIATVLSRYVELAIIVIYAHAHKARFAFLNGVYSSLHVPGRLFKDIIVRGMPLLVNEFFWSTGMTVLLQCYSVRGLDVVAASNITNTVSNLFRVVFMAIGSAVAIMLGQALGANQVEKAKATFWRLSFLDVASNVVMGAMLALIARAIPYAFNTTDHVRGLATNMIYVVALMMPVCSFAHCCYFTLRSGGKTGITFLFDSGFTWFASVPVAYVLTNHTGVSIVLAFAAVQAIEFIKAAVGFILVRRGVWIRNIIGYEAGGEDAC